MSSPTDPASLALAGNLAITSDDGRLRMSGIASSTLPVKLHYVYVTLRDADNRIIYIPETHLKSRTGESHELEFDQFVGRSVLAAARSIELTVPYNLEATADLAIVRAGEPDGNNRVPLTITTRGTLPFIELLTVGAYFNPGWPLDSYRGLDVYVELDVCRGGRPTFCTISARARAEDGTVLAEGRAVLDHGRDRRRLFQIVLQFKDGTATQLEIMAEMTGGGIGQLGPIAVEGL